MKIFKELNKLGYKHYTEYTIEELDNLPLNSEKRTIEQSLVLRWFDDNTDYIGFIVPSAEEFGFTYEIHNGFDVNVSEEEAYPFRHQAELACLKKLIEIVKNK